jgi:hypothetical protein
MWSYNALAAAHATMSFQVPSNALLRPMASIFHLQTFMPCCAVLCHAVLCCAMLQVLSDVRGLTSALADESAIELWGKVGTAHLASLLTAAAHK